MKTQKIITAISFFVFSLGPANFYMAAAQDPVQIDQVDYALEERQTRIKNALDRASFEASDSSPDTAKNQNPAVYGSGYVVSTTEEQFVRQKFVEQRESLPDESGREYKKNIIKNKDSMFSWDLGTELYNYVYREPTINVDRDGTYYGIYSIFTYRTQKNQPLSTFDETFSENSNINMFRLEGRAAYGNVDYEGSGTYTGINDYVYELRGLAGYDLPASDTLLFTPYFGFGYRNHYDDSGGGVTSTGYWTYDRESRYVYLPFGLEAEKTWPNNWSLQAAFEYDIFLMGDQISHLEDGGDGSYSSLENDQDSGFGLRGSIKISKLTKKIDFIAEPFIRYWHVEDSNLGYACGGLYDICLAGYEPKNNTTEYGLKFGLKYK